MTELLPCPFCGEHAEIYSEPDMRIYPEYAVRCTGCGMGDGGYRRREYVADAWNTRTPATPEPSDLITHALLQNPD